MLVFKVCMVILGLVGCVSRASAQTSAPCVEIGTSCDPQDCDPTNPIVRATCPVTCKFCVPDDLTTVDAITTFVSTSPTSPTSPTTPTTRPTTPTIPTTTADPAAATTIDFFFGKDPCASGPCKNGALCFSSSAVHAEFICECVNGFFGRTCEIPPDPCQSGPCQNNGRCFPAPDNFSHRCLCEKGFAGDNCEIWEDPCDSHPCEHGGTCYHSNSAPTQYLCGCMPGITGTDCEIIYDPCASDPCMNGSICFHHGHSDYRCVCPDHTTGDHCQKTPCQPNPCQNGGTCFYSNVNMDDYKCACRQNYFGEHCESDQPYRSAAGR